MDGAASVVQMVLSLIAVVAIILGLAWMTRRMQVMRGASGSELIVRATLAVGLKERVVLIEVRGEPMLIGVAPGQVTLLQASVAMLPRDEAAPGESGGAPGATASTPPRMSFSSAFAHQLNQLLGR